VEAKLRREGRNLSIAGIAAVTLPIAGALAVLPLTYLVDSRGWGLLPRLGLPKWAEVALVLVLMDYTFYLWHVMTHRVSFLWRFHVVHHADLDLDASTALRFHLGELLLGVPYQAAQVLLIGITPATYSIWQTTFLVAILFHHSALKLPYEWERRLSWFLVTPRMHGIHHSIVRSESDANWSSGLNIWDRLHGTLRLNVPQEQVSIGVPAYRTADAVRFPKLVAMPFVPQPPSWQFRDGTNPVDHTEGVPRSLLLP